MYNSYYCDNLQGGFKNRMATTEELKDKLNEIETRIDALRGYL
jgi:hypothetical protein